ncbi:MAG: SPFH domain-containing protein [Verrucomicrobiia bacterium]|jgi:flotillin
MATIILAALKEELGISPMIVLVVAGIVAVVVIFALVYASRYTKVGPNEVLIISGRRHRILGADGQARVVGYRLLTGGGAFVWPIFEKVDVLSLEILTIDVQTPEVYTVKGVPIIVDGVAQIKVRGDDVSIRTSAEQFLSKTADEIRSVALQTLEGHLRAILGTMSVEEVYQNREAFAQRVQEVAATDLANMGLMIVSFTIRDIKDNQGYLEALGRPRTAQVKRDALIGQAEADRDAIIRSAQANQSGQEAKFVADTKVAEANRDYQMKVAEYQASVNQRKAEADLAYDLQRFKTGQAVKAEQIQVDIVEKQKQIELQQQEIQRRQKELEATVQKPADAQRYQVETLATAKRFQLETEAAGNASAIKATGIAEAEANKAKGFAQADVIKAQGVAEAEAMARKADSFKQYNEAAVIQMLIAVLPEVAGKISEPLAKTDRITIISSGDGTGAGASKVTGDITNIMAQLPAVIESLTGVQLQRLLEQVPALKAAMTTREEDREKSAKK